MRRGEVSGESPSLRGLHFRFQAGHRNLVLIFVLRLLWVEWRRSQAGSSFVSEARRSLRREPPPHWVRI
eukprot:4429007-Pyramimonas_sp.AAC.1